ncbi:hypothetical protein [Paraburkholderia tropica]|uniref:Uncharacterized protein n=1 Tax=Paraburkholderia tropica TaxID=92647 RepID=A0ABX5MY48_9BURK|nr:hypothetical protein [Paraburkholderia tropica]MDE1139188.1 hypothetical protein [Paraburkholderia tropica]PXX19634.1 hypothetical protein C7400_10258 [Paraburkholderia tropica]PZW88575.1 hypothetical protein C7399_10258 [Paraburkholderia tropica]
MSTSQTLAIVAKETNPVAPGSCAACQRKGLPILPLRQAVLRAHSTPPPPKLQPTRRRPRPGTRILTLLRKQDCLLSM